jgi:ATP-dependent Clp protease ATP-binding subunit ClpC
VTYERMKERVNTALKAHFRPEFLNRIDDVIVFHELAMDEVVEIAEMLLTRTKDQLALQGIGLELTPAARQRIAEKGYDPMLGARPLRRAIQSMVEDPLSEKLLWKEFRSGETILIDSDPDTVDGLVFSSIEGFVPPTPEFAGSAPAAD